MACTNNNYLQCCSDNNVVVLPCSGTFNIGEVWVDSNGICWEVIGTTGTVTTSYSPTGLSLYGVDCGSCVSDYGNQPCPTPDLLPTPTPTPTVTQTTPCNCNYFDLTVSQTDLDDATGNITFQNGVIYVQYVNCYGQTIIDTFGIAGTIEDAFCANFVQAVTYYKNDIPLAPLSSFATDTLIDCCNVSTPSPTPTQTTTPTQTPTPTVDCVCYIYGFTANVLTDATWIDCDGTPQSQSVPGSASIIACARTTSPFGGDGTWNKQDPCDNWCSPGSTPTQTPTQTSTPTNTPDITPTQTPTNTSTQTVTPTSCECVDGIFFEVYTSGTITYFECDGTFGSISSGIGPAAISGCIQKDSLGGSATIGDFFYGTCCSVNITPTQTPTQTETPTETPTQTPTHTNTPTQTETPTETPTSTPTHTQTQTPTNTPTPSLTVTITDTVPITPSQTPTETPTQTPTESETPTPTPTHTNTPTPTDTPTPTPTPTPTHTNTPTPTDTPTPTPTHTQTPSNSQTPTPSITPSPTQGFIVQFQDCTDSTNIFRYTDPIISSVNVGETYLISGTTQFSGCATVITYTASGPIFDGNGVLFIGQSGCGDDDCPTSSVTPALLTRCSDSQVFFATVRTDTAFVGAVYLYNGVCYSFVEFSGDGGPYLGIPFSNTCDIPECAVSPTPTATSITPTPTPTPSVTPQPCPSDVFCFRTSVSGLSNYNGNYTNTYQFYNSKYTYTGDSASPAIIYYFTSSTESYWCLASGSTPGGTCILRGSQPCLSQCPDISASDFSSGICPSPTPTIDCAPFNFEAYFDCDYTPPVTPSPTIDCDDVDFDVTSIQATPTPTPSPSNACNVSMVFSFSAYTPSVTPTATIVPTPTPTKTVPADGQVTFTMMEKTFSCVSAKVIIDCKTNEIFYTNDEIKFNGISIVIGQYFLANINGQFRCLFYEKDDSNVSSNSSIDEVSDVFAFCDSCSPEPPASQTPTPTQTATQTPTMTQTPTHTLTNTPTPTPTPTIGTTPSTPTPTPTVTPTNTQTQTPTKTNTPTPTMTPSLEYVFTSCEPIGFKILNLTAIIQSLPPTNNYAVGSVFKDDVGNCWTYVGIFQSGSYIPPQGVITQTFDGDYFANASTTIYETCVQCVEVEPEVSVTFAGAGTQPCIGGTVDDYLAWTVNLSGPAPVDINYQLEIVLSNNGFETVYSASGTVPQGQTSDECNNNPCGCGGAFVGGGYQVVSVCISSIDNGVFVPQQFLC